MSENEEKDYNVSLTFPVSATSPKEAIDQFIEKVNLHGLRTWVYVLENLSEPGRAEYVNGSGVHVEPEDEDE